MNDLIQEIHRHDQSMLLLDQAIDQHNKVVEQLLVVKTDSPEFKKLNDKAQKLWEKVSHYSNNIEINLPSYE